MPAVAAPQRRSITRASADRPRELSLHEHGKSHLREPSICGHSSCYSPVICDASRAHLSQSNASASWAPFLLRPSPSCRPPPPRSACRPLTRVSPVNGPHAGGNPTNTLPEESPVDVSTRRQAANVRGACKREPCEDCSLPARSWQPLLLHAFQNFLRLRATGTGRSGSSISRASFSHAHCENAP